ncbi:MULTISPECIES: MarR family winged helix-turn-helix transcriptional regulator [Comamonas]|jgi:DNA-binding MarR family transcriptional regulator|uniref:MarR family winged helix-turn-helix transcriptional regulator n=1 Tax=Comamonas TaxID=283 RepID=UPI0012C56475|nr:MULTISPECIES: MarR family winged helix-turn-helix transcriptional regulator [Comamonas]MDR3065659.1 MarR family winged helix-turn-helix transcriptional regulator [Comamonas sp.]MEB5963509.1 MarR family winged helix-turn-helix transcriptional regulator [Comamonas testosteroni]MPS94237.1 MarR family transcriptional regulator [Comamonas sp.]
MLAHKTVEPDSKPVRSLRGPRAREAQAAGVGPESESKSGAEVFAVDQVDASFLESLLGYNARRASLSLVGVFMRCMERFDLKIVEFSVLSLVGSNPGITSRQLCQQLAVLPPNMVGMIDALGKRGFLERRPHPRDGRATGLYLTAAGGELVETAEPELKNSETRAIAHLSAAEQAQLMELLQKLYR